MGKTKFSPVNPYETQVDDGIKSVFSNVEIALRVFRRRQLLTALQNAIFSDMLRRVVLNQIIQDFAIRKSSKKLF